MPPPLCETGFLYRAHAGLEHSSVCVPPKCWVERSVQQPGLVVVIKGAFKEEKPRRSSQRRQGIKLGKCVHGVMNIVGPMQTSAYPTPQHSYVCSVLLPSLQSEWCWSNPSTFSLWRYAIASVYYNVLINEYEYGSRRGWVCVASGLCSIMTPGELAFAHKRVHPVSGQPQLQEFANQCDLREVSCETKVDALTDRKVFLEWLKF